LIKTIIIILFLTIITAAYSANNNSKQDKSCKVRLPEEINSYQPALVPVITPDGRRLYFDRKNHPENVNGVKDFDDIWYCNRDSLGTWTEAKNFKALNTVDSDVLFSVSPDGTTCLVYGKYENKKFPKKAGFSLVKHINGKWTFPKPLNIKNYYNDSLNFYANLSADEKTFLLAVSRNDGFGGLDLYVSFQNDSLDEWSEPMNLGNEINTPYNEETPFLAYDNKTLYFSSDGRNGYGGQDLYMTKRLDDTWKNWSQPINLGPTINTGHDESSIYLTALGDSAYIVSYDSLSKRRGIYYACLPDEMRPTQYAIVYLNLLSIENQLISDSAQINIFNESNGYKLEYKKEADTDKCVFVLPENGKYNITVNASGFQCEKFEINFKNKKECEYIFKNVTLKRTQNESKPLLIYFDTDVAELSHENLQILADVFSNMDLKNIKLLVIGNADKTGTAEYNKVLSYKRAFNTKVYLSKLGINENNISIEAKGDTEPVSDILSKNRRVEIIKIK
jgi:OOP family OmpA-OmpF porin